MKNKLALSFVTLGACMVGSLSFFWIIIECVCTWIFDHEFNWWCVWIFLASIISIIVSSTFFSKIPIDPNTSESKNRMFQQMKLQFDMDLPERLSTADDFEKVLNYFLPKSSWKMNVDYTHKTYPKVLIEFIEPNKKTQLEELKRYIADQKAVFIQVDYVELIVKK